LKQVCGLLKQSDESINRSSKIGEGRIALKVKTLLKTVNGNVFDVYAKLLHHV